MPKAGPNRRLFPRAGNGNALPHRFGYRGFGGDLQQTLPLLIAEWRTADQDTVDVLATVLIPVKIQTHINITQLPAFTLGIHTQGNRGAGTEPGQQ